MTKIVSASHAFTEREWFLVMRLAPDNFQMRFAVKAFETKEQAERANNAFGALVYEGQTRVMHRAGFIEDVCKAAADNRVDVVVEAHLDSGMVYPVEFLVIDRDTVEIKLPESVDA